MWTTADAIAIPISVAICVALGVLAYFLLRNRPRVYKQIPLMLTVGVMIVLEIIKITRHLVIADEFNSRYLPFHMSSYFMVWFSLAAFGWGRVRQVGMTASFITSFGFLFGFFYQPSWIIGGASANLFNNWGAFHSFVYHLMFIQFLIFIIALDLFRPKIKYFLFVLPLIFGLLSISLVMAHVLQVNYFNLLYGTGPFAYISENWGQWVLVVILFALSLAAGCLAFFAFGIPYELVRQRFRKTENKGTANRITDPQVQEISSSEGQSTASPEPS